MSNVAASRRLMPTSLSGLSGFFQWWFSELSSLPIFAEYSPRLSHAMVVDSDGQNGRLLIKSSDQSSSASQESVSLAEIFESVVPAGAPVIVRLPHRLCYSRDVVLPNAASRDFEKILAIDLERVTPFRMKDVYSRHIIAKTAGNGPFQPIKQYVLKRSIADGIKAQAQARGHQLAGIEIWNADHSAALPITFLEQENQPRPARSAWTLRAVAGLAVVLAISAVGLSFYRQQTALDDLKEQTAALRIKAGVARELAEKSQTASTFASSFNKLRTETVSRAAIIEEITRVLPDSAWLSDIKINGTSVDISGLASSASALIADIERSPYFVDATAISPITFDPHEDKERFGIRMQLRGFTTAAAAPVEEQPQ